MQPLPPALHPALPLLRGLWAGLRRSSFLGCKPLQEKSLCGHHTAKAAAAAAAAAATAEAQGAGSVGENMQGRSGRERVVLSLRQ